jgi:hypothetical protein
VGRWETPAAEWTLAAQFKLKPGDAGRHRDAVMGAPPGVRPLLQLQHTAGGPDSIDHCTAQGGHQIFQCEDLRCGVCRSMQLIGGSAHRTAVCFSDPTCTPAPGMTAALAQQGSTAARQHLCAHHSQPAVQGVWVLQVMSAYITSAVHQGCRVAAEDRPFTTYPREHNRVCAFSVTSFCHSSQHWWRHPYGEPGGGCSRIRHRLFSHQAAPATQRCWPACRHSRPDL